MDNRLRELERLARQGDPGARKRLEAAQGRAGTIPGLDCYTVGPIPADFTTDDGKPALHSHGQTSRTAVLTVAKVYADCGDETEYVIVVANRRGNPVNEWLPNDILGSLDTSGAGLLAVDKDENHPLAIAVSQMAYHAMGEHGRDYGQHGRCILLTYRPDPMEDPVIDKSYRDAQRVIVRGARHSSGYPRYDTTYRPDIEWDFGGYSGLGPKITDDDIRESVRILGDVGSDMIPEGTEPEDGWPDAYFILVDYAHEGMGADILAQANSRAIREHHNDALECGCLVDADNGFYIRCGMTCEHRESLADLLSGLADYPVVDDDVHSEMEAEDDERNWDDYLRSDILSAIKGATGLDFDIPASVVTAEVPREHDPFQSWLYDRMRETDVYTERSDDATTFDEERFIEKMGDDLLPGMLALVRETPGATFELAEGGPATLMTLPSGEVIIVQAKGRQATKGRAARNATRRWLIREMTRSMWAGPEVSRVLKSLPRTRKGMRCMLSMVQGPKRQALGAAYRATRKEGK